MSSNHTGHRKKVALLSIFISFAMAVLMGRLVYLMMYRSEHYSQMAEDLHQRERTIKAARGNILDANGTVIATNRTVCTISVIYNQVRDREQVIRTLCQELELEEAAVRKKVEKRSSREIIQTNVDKETGDRIRGYHLAGVKVDEDYKRYYPYDSLASKVLGFTGGDNQGIIGLEVMYEKYLKGINGTILTMTDAAGVELENTFEDRIEPVPGNDLYISLDVNIQKYAEQAAYETMERKGAKRVSVIVMNPKNGEIMAMANVPEFNLNEPFTLNTEYLSGFGVSEAAEGASGETAGSAAAGIGGDAFERTSVNAAAGTDTTAKRSGSVAAGAGDDASGERSGGAVVETAAAASANEKQELLNQMWRNTCINDTYEPGSTFKIITAAAGLESGAVKLTDQFSCPGFRIVEDRKIRCHKVGGHGGETFLQGVMNSCNPVFIDVGQRLGVDNYYHYFEQFGLKKKTGIDLPGEAATIMHKKENMGLVELATVSFGQSFQITPIQLITTASSIINGGNRITPHFGVKVVSEEQGTVHRFSWPYQGRILSEETSALMRQALEKVVAEGSGKKAALEGYRIGGKTATSEKLPRSLKKYISSFIGFAPADDPRVIALITIDEPQGVYYGGTIAAPVIADIFKNILPYLGIEKEIEEKIEEKIEERQ